MIVDDLEYTSTEEEKEKAEVWSEKFKKELIKTGTVIWEIRYDGSTEIIPHHLYYRDYPVYEGLPDVAKSEETYKEWKEFWLKRRSEVGKEEREEFFLLECQHKWVHLETFYSSESAGCRRRNYKRVDRFYCEKCLKQEDIVKEQESTKIPRWYIGE